jgi:thiol-disulfide isomerase/thioredoxin
MKNKLGILFGLILLFNCNQSVKNEKDISLIENNDNQNKIELNIVDFNALEPLLNNQDDQVYVINFWATWCAPCVKELPVFEKLHDEYKNKNVKVILVSLDFPKQYESKLIPFIKENNLQSEIIVLDDTDSNTWIPKVSEEWSGAIPATLIYSKDQRKFFENSFNYNELKTEVQQFIK